MSPRFLLAYFKEESAILLIFIYICTTLSIKSRLEEIKVPFLTSFPYLGDKVSYPVAKSRSISPVTRWFSRFNSDWSNADK